MGNNNLLPAFYDVNAIAIFQIISIFYEGEAFNLELKFRNLRRTVTLYFSLPIKIVIVNVEFNGHDLSILKLNKNVYICRCHPKTREMHSTKRRNS